MKTRAEYLKEYGADYYIEKKWKRASCSRLEKEYILKRNMFQRLQCLYINILVTMKNAFYFHGLTDVIPDECDLATTRDATKIKDKRVKQCFIPDVYFEEGMAEK